MSIEAGPRRNYPGIDLIRLCAALSVAAYHLGFWWWQDNPRLPELAPFVSWGWVGVPVFFVISGFVIAFSAQGRTTKQFVKSRAARLYPASWICASIIALAQPTPLLDYVRSIILFPIGPWVSGVYWTLAVEIIFYAVVALALWRRWNLARVALCLGYYSTAFWLLRALNSYVGKPVDFTVIENHVGYLLLAHDGMFFAFGMLLSERRYRLSALVFLFSGFVAVATRSHAITAVGPVMAPPIIWLGATLAVTASVFFKIPIASARTIGLMTYPLYLIHMEIGHLIMLQISNPWLAFIVAMSASVTLAAAVLPLEAWTRRKLFHRSANQPVRDELRLQRID